MIVEILTVNLPQEMKPFRMEERFIAYSNPNEPGELMSFPEARRAYLGLGDEGHLGFIADDPAPSKPDYSQPVPSLLSKKKRALVPNATSE
jgi:hypothetical protein